MQHFFFVVPSRKRYYSNSFLICVQTITCSNNSKTKVAEHHNLDS